MLNRADARTTIVESDADDAAFDQVFKEAAARTRLLPYPVIDRFYKLCRYVERNSGVGSSLYRWKSSMPKEKSVLAGCPLPHWPGWVEHVNGPQTAAELVAVRRRLRHGSPFGEPS